MNLPSTLAGRHKKNSPSKVRPMAQPAPAAGLRVRWLENADRAPATAVERAAINLLRREQELSFDTLVDFIAESLFHEEVHTGAWAIDLGLLGSGLFVPEARCILEAGRGERWEIVSI
jgi:hypothetical protein